MPVLMIGPAEREVIARIIEYAKAHPITFDVLRKGVVTDKPLIMLEDRQPGFERPKSAWMQFPGGYEAAYSVEVQPAGLCAHLSVSVVGRGRKGMCPSPEAVAMIAAAFGVTIPAHKVWTEEYEPGEFSINVLHVYQPVTEGTA